jgi:hypothetical protein
MVNMDPPQWYTPKMKQGFVQAQNARRRNNVIRKLTRPIRRIFALKR